MLPRCYSCIDKVDTISAGAGAEQAQLLIMLILGPVVSLCLFLNFLSWLDSIEWFDATYKK